jgi:hypothetical protein
MSAGKVEMRVRVEVTERHLEQAASGRTAVYLAIAEALQTKAVVYDVPAFVRTAAGETWKLPSFVLRWIERGDTGMFAALRPIRFTITRKEEPECG